MGLVGLRTLPFWGFMVPETGVLIFSSYSMLCLARKLAVHSMEHRSYSKLVATMLTPHKTSGILDTMRARRTVVRRQRYRASKLTRYRAELVTMRQAGASYREIAFWMRRDHRLRVDHSTIRRYLIQLPELMQEEEGHAELSQGD